MVVWTQAKCSTGVYLFYSTIKPAAIPGISGGHTAIKSANTVWKPHELSKFKRDGGERTPGSLPRPSIFYLCDGQNLISLSREVRMPNLISKGQKVVIYP